MKRLSSGVAFALFSVVSSGALAASEIYVDSSVETAGDGSSWASAYKSVEQAVTDIEAGGKVYVKGGTYALANTIELNGKADVSILGGYAGDGAPGTRDIAAYRTTLDAGGQFRVMKASQSAGPIIDGLVIKGGLRTSAQDEVYNNAGKPTTFQKSILGGGIFLDRCEDAVLRNCDFTGNCVSNVSAGILTCGGGLAAFGGAVSVVGCVFRGNFAYITKSGSPFGGAIATGGAGVKSVQDCVFYGNFVRSTSTKAVAGGAIYNQENQNSGREATISNCLIVANFSCANAPGSGATYVAGGNVAGGKLTLKSCTVLGANGEGLSADLGNSKITATDSIFAWNGNDVNPYYNLDKITSREKLDFARCLFTNLLEPEAFTLTDCQFDQAVEFGPDCRPTDARYAAFGCTVTGPWTAWTDLYVDPAAASDGTGAADSPFRTIAAALEASGDWTRIHLADGTYSPAANGETFPVSIRNRIGVQLLGASPRGAVLDGGGVETVGLHLVSVSVSALVKLSGLTLRNALQSGTVKYHYAGCGLHVDCSQVQVEDSLIADNVCNFKYGPNNSNREGYVNGVGVATLYSGVSFVRTDVLGNRLGYALSNAQGGNVLRGGGVSLCVSRGFSDGCRLVGNGLAADVAVRTDAECSGCSGGAIMCESSQFRVMSALFASNTLLTVGQAQCGGYGIYSNGLGAAVALRDAGFQTVASRSRLILDNCTIDANKGSYTLNNLSGTIKLNNCFLRPTAGDEALNGAATAKSCAFTGPNAAFVDGEDGNFILKRDPSASFRGLAKGDYELVSGSELINGGERLFWMTDDSKDLYGKKRVSGRVPDIGCAEYSTGLLLILR